MPLLCNVASLPKAILTILRAGVPHVVLPVWYDTYDYAQRAEYLGIGIYPNRHTAPHIKANDLSEAIWAVLEDSKSGPKVLERVREVKALCAQVEGREVATRKILDIMEGEIERRGAGVKRVPY